MNPKADFQKALKALCHRQRLWQVFSDFCELAALSIANSVTIGPERDEREERYLEIMKRYQGGEPKQLGQMLGMVAYGLEGMECDFLGESFMELDLGSDWGGQFFTPYDLCRMMAAMQAAPGVKAAIEQNGFATANDPACGAGAMMMALARELHDQKINYQQCLHVTCIDVDPTAAHMAYVQLSLLHVPAKVLIGNTLTMEMREVFYTPAHIMGLWDGKLKRGYALGSHADDPVTEPVTLSAGDQGDLFGEDAA